MPHLLFSPLQLLFGLVTQCHLFPIGERAWCMTRPSKGCKRDYAYCSSNREKIKINHLQNIIPCTFTIESELKLLYLQYTLTKYILQSRIVVDTMHSKKRIIFYGGFLDWLSPNWTLPSVCEICDKMQVVYKESTCNWVKSKVAKSKFYL